ncbi:1-acyl-sn-glycerol-3-phosphate acyltransferase [Sansalvadorimonas verongulae]|uniref:1-acyl-sn-glycerol-3-phosphate acyltransferase n=1 Tax=Sansalvadorimonas verongulae TaxID=2172824 RepID=UPI0012BC938E|nr:1-acyl-sn-glycerol-3-phosphate acyltransferase [Sansalvadorimonas verongulae]MTI12433.1 glycerol acyltransferase [Sansalvadorimonas verongulae]
MQSFDDIRPYNDHEVAPVLAQLVGNPHLLRAIGHFYFSNVPACVRNFMQPLVSMRVRKMVAGIKDVYGLQRSIAPFLEQIIEKTSCGLTWSGLENLPQNKGCLLLSNHRDIVMDPALVNYALFNNGRDTARIAIGDNLLGRPYVADLMRLNKSFIVKRSVAGRREKLLALQKLSAYISHSIEEGSDVWMAHREGRAKDGDDRTDTAILKMLHMSFRKDKRSFGELLEFLNIIPVSISYEYDPCAVHKAVELQAREAYGEYDKEEDEDLNSILTGIEGFKGRMHVAFGKPVNPALETPQDVASAIDQQMHDLYRLWPSNWLAKEILENCAGQGDWRQLFSANELAEHESRFQQALESCPEDAQQWLLKIYANPAINSLAV